MKESKKKLKKLGEDVLGEFESGKNPSIEIPTRSLKNVEYIPEKGLITLGQDTSKRFFFNVSHAKKFMQTLMVAKMAKKLVEENATTSIRDLFYSLKIPIEGMKDNIFNDQVESDPIIEDLEVSLDLLREEMNLRADKKGTMIGDMVIEDAGDQIDLRKQGSGGWSIPSKVEPDVIKFKEHTAKFVLFVEKSAVWERLNEDKVWKKLDCVMITGKGQPSRGIRRLMHRMRYELNLPVVVFNDADPWGYYIHSVIKQGSINLAFLSQKVGIPDARYVGLTTMDMKKFDISRNVADKLNQGDIKRAKELLNYQWFKTKDWVQEINFMLKEGIKLEMEALSNKGIRYVSETYLPQKVENKDFLD
jgi:DNA topoisomerase-6 subunit A